MRSATFSTQPHTLPGCKSCRKQQVALRQAHLSAAGIRQKRGHSTVQASAATEAPSNVRMPDWVGIHRQLTTQYKLRSISPQEAQKLVQKGTHIIVDVRYRQRPLPCCLEAHCLSPLLWCRTWTCASLLLWCGTLTCFWHPATAEGWHLYVSLNRTAVPSCSALMY